MPKSTQHSCFVCNDTLHGLCGVNTEESLNEINSTAKKCKNCHGGFGDKCWPPIPPTVSVDAPAPKATGLDKLAEAALKSGQAPAEKPKPLLHRHLAAMSVLTSFSDMVTTLQTQCGTDSTTVYCIEEAKSREFLPLEYQRLQALAQAVSNRVLQSTPRTPGASPVFKLLYGFKNFKATINPPDEPAENGEILLQLCGDIQVQAKPAENLLKATICAGDAYYHLPSSPTIVESFGASVSMLIYQSL